MTSLPRSVPRLLLEGIAILSSILLAFAIDAWWDGRQLESEEAELLTGLAQEFEVASEQLTLGLRQSSTGRDYLRAYLSMTPDQARRIPEAESWLKVYEPQMRVWQNRPTTSFLDATISSGKLALIGDPELRASLAEIETLKAVGVEVLGFIHTYQVQALALLGGYEGVQAALVSPDLPQLSSDTMASLRASADLVALATAKLQYWDVYLGSLEDLQDGIHASLDLIRARQAM